MSYCRWSSDDFQCDLYCYEDCQGGYTTHVAGNRIIGDIPKLADIETASSEDFVASYEKQHAFLENCQRKPIELPYNGETFNDTDLQSFLERLLELKKLGYNFPEHVIEEVKAEIGKK